MRIRKRFAPSYFSSEPLADLHLNQSLSNGNQAKPKSDQPSNPPQQPSDQNMVIIKWALHPNAAITGKRKEMESGEDEEKPSSDDIRNARILVQEVDIKFLQPSSSSDPADGRWREDDKIVPLKKRKGTLNRCASNETLTKARMKSKTNKKCLQEKADHDGNYCPNKKRANVILEGSRCSRVNGRGWRCCQPTLVGYALCEHHLGKGRLRSMTSVRKSSKSAPMEVPSSTETTRSMSSILCALDVEDSKGLEETENDDEKKRVEFTKKRTKVGMVKARSISSLLGQIDSKR
ncbi:Hypothetical predicted protein [Olea europaea subsp. europaea]|uniref:WRC domain-containing protein n=3 Tax=Olea europaea subsp. europaea TaxID=158383 RepID=A0A8S0RJ82_OLEEU|nr:Hypothetical predicted protein [Olea europaea subsp. europaea]